MARRIKTLKNTTPCCNSATHMHHERYPDDHEMEWGCKKCGRNYHVTFENVEPLRGCGIFRLVKWELLTNAGGVPLDEE